MITEKQWLMMLFYALLASICFPIGIGFIYWKKINIGFKQFIVFQCIYFLILIQSLILTNQGGNSSFWGYIVAINDCITYSTVFIILLKDYKSKKRLIALVLFITATLCLDFVLEINHSKQKLFSLTLETVYINTLTLLFLAKLMISLKLETLVSNPIFWFGIAKLIPATYSLILEAFQDFLIEDNIELFKGLYQIDLGFHVLGNILYGYSIWLSRNFNFKVFKEIEL